MATVLQFNSSPPGSPSSYYRFLLSPSLPQNFFHRPLKLPVPPQPPLPSPVLKNSKFHHALHSSALPTHFLPSPETSVSDSKPLFLSQSFSYRDFPDVADSLVDRLFNLLRLSARYNDAELARAVHASVVKLEEDTHLENALIVAYLKLGLFSDAYNVFLGLACPDVVSYTALISGFSKSNREHTALELFFRMRNSGIEPNEYSFVAILTTCIRIMHLNLGLQIHNMAIKTGFLDSAFVANALMGLYGKCGCYEVVLKLFSEIRERDIASWNTVISVAVKELMYHTAFQLFRDMQTTDALRVDYFTLSTLLTACAGSVAVMEGKQVHAHAMKVGLDTNLSVSNALIGFYTKCGTLDNVVSVFMGMTVRDVITWTEMVTAYMGSGLVNLALKIFDEMPHKNSVSYNTLLSGFCQNGEGLKALDLFLKMAEEGIELTDFSLTSAISACSLLADYRVSKQIHGFVLKFGFGSNVCIEAALLDMYTRCGRMEDAEKMFCRWRLEEGSSVAWTCMICGYARNGQPDEASSLVHLSQLEGKMLMDEIASSSVLSLCGTIGCHELGKQIHCHVLELGFQSDVGIGNAVVSIYLKCWNVDDAIKMFNNMPVTDIVSWNALIAGHLLHRLGDRALEIWSNMQKEGIKPDKGKYAMSALSSLLRRNPLQKLACKSVHGYPRSDHYTRQRSIKPFIPATLSKPAAAISSVPSSSSTVTSGEDPLAVSSLPPRPRVFPDSLQYPSGFLGAVPDRTDSDGNDSIIKAMGYLTNILSSKVYDVAIESPLQLATKLSGRLGTKVWLKREDLQPVFSFKLRGAYNMMAKLPKEQLEKGVICSSAGNHAQGVALSAKRLNCSAVIVMPVTTPEIKWRSVERMGATVVLVGDSYDEAQAYAKKRAKEECRTFVPPFDHPDVIMGQGTVGMEIVRQMQGPLHAIFVPVGGGGLIAGIAAFVKRVSPQVKIIGVEPADANAMALSLHHGQRVILDKVGGFADGVAVKEVGEETFRLCKELVDGVVLVSRDSICASMKNMFEEKRNILEPAGALALAGAEAYCKYYGLKGKNVIAITSGANMNFDQLRVVIELANVGRKQEAMLVTAMPEEPGSFKQFCQLVGQMNITELKYRYNSDKKAVVLYSVGVHTVSELKAMQERMESSQLKTHNLTESDLVKDHLRYLMGGRSNGQNEVLCRFVFPERPGALMKFLDSFGPRWNISLFHYRGQGETGANVLVGIQMPRGEMVEFHDRADRVGYDYAVVNNEDDFQLLMS